MTREDDRARAEFTSEAEELLDTLSRDLVEFESQGTSVRPELVKVTKLTSPSSSAEECLPFTLG